MDIKLPTSFEELTAELELIAEANQLSTESDEILDDTEQELNNLQETLNELEENINSRRSSFALIQFKKNRKKSSEWDDDCLLTDPYAYDLLCKISTLLFTITDKDGNIKLKDISQEKKDEIINTANWYIKEAIIDLPKELTTHIEANPQEHYCGNSMRRLEQLLKIRQMIITYIIENRNPSYYRYMYIAAV